MLSSHSCILLWGLALVGGCCAAGAPSPEQTAATSTTSSSILPNPTPTWTNSTHQAAGNFSLYDKLPSLWFETCANNNQNPPCTAYCRSNDTECLRAADVVVPACAGLWNTYNGHVFDWRISGGVAPSGWSTVLSTYGADAIPSTTTVNVYTSFSTANATLTRQHPTDARLPKVTITPVYAVGNPVPSVSVETASPYSGVVSYITAPQPSCRYAALKTTNDCGQCSIYGGTVELLFWPPTTSTTSAGAPVITKSTVWDGITLFSPTVYISLSTVYASNSCMQVGQNHTGTLLAMKPEDVSTQIHIGGKVAAYTYGRVDYADLVGLPPLDDYEAQPSCIMFGCSTIFPTYSPTLVVPMALRTLEADWSSCVAALEGLYDPPIALTEAAVAFSITAPSRPAHTEAYTSTTLMLPLASEHIPLAAPTPTPTTSQDHPNQIKASSIVQGLESLLNGGEIAVGTTKAAGVTSSGSLPISSTLEFAPLDSDQSASSTLLLSLSASQPDDGYTSKGSVPEHTTARSQDDSRSFLPGPHAPSALSSTHTTTSTHSIENDTPQPIAVSQDDQGNFIVNGKTFAPGLPVTLTRSGTTVAASMLTSSGRTFIALGTASTVPLGDIGAGSSYSLPPVVTATSSISHAVYTAAGITFEANEDGELVFSSKTVALGGSVTLGSGSSIRTIFVTNLGNQTAIVVGNTTTARLVVETSSSTSHISHDSVGPTSSRPANRSGIPQSTTATPPDSNAAILRTAGFANIFLAILSGIWLGT
ncbi:hypothetical protein CLAFUW4_08520 [Fulvia fulva]|uniref:Uncharacterized protein n=1 Tax=Passalora fulva TaxID=5499 RepID=A0A9Q8LC34_PASFU|nr:uncharacterized protein CLAFUR5_08622 [Fulvia fulva]KAK4629721.1 hypothetical protein CLAFUR4_08525 [Fulvia fulva]KAK4630694.1 hypothetical protein CLAFUR0_08520 [Fulvia fulva]UJO14644.1 hypothetical protein CLAFUR5_08622 [Fulvia fulva]WPV12289.1 hypothetical protein CLAFUW4_08520 [Fulvia fulva]WPV27475.1 hypothetical protein CLAFUW7_08520 [Fulvia fulva]